MNRAIAEASGEFLAFLDHDDLWAERKLEAQVQHLAAHPEADLTFCWYRWIDEQGRELKIPPSRWRGAISFDELVRDFVIGMTSTIMARRSVVVECGGFDKSLARAYDQDLVLRIALLRPGNVQATPEELASYRRHPTQMSRHWHDAVPEWQKLLGRILSYQPLTSKETLVIGSSNMQRYFAWLAYQEEAYRQACLFVAGAFRISPLRAAADRRNWLLGGASLAGLLLPSRFHRWLEAAMKRVMARELPNAEPMLAWLAPVSLLLLWQLAVTSKTVDPLLVPSPADLARCAVRLTKTGELPLHLMATLRRLGLGLLAGGSAGIIIGTFLGTTEFARRVLEPLLLALGSVPKVTLLPLVMLLVGVNESARTTPVAASCLVIMALHVIEGVRAIDQKLVQLARHYGASPGRLLLDVYLPSILPAIFTGLRVAIGTALVVTISTELLGANSGLGNLIWSSYQVFAIDKLYLGVVLAAFTGLILQWMLSGIRRRVIPWS